MTVATLTRATVIERTAPMRDAVELILHHPEAAATVEPGQFFQLGVEAPQAILRRPYSIAWADPARGRIAFLFTVVGLGSAWLAAREAGQAVELLGPLGRGFTTAASDRPAVCVAGGVGVAAFPALVQRLNALGRPVTMLQGARSADRLLPAGRLDGVEVINATDDGSAGHRGPVTDLLRTIPLGRADLFVCGPMPMLQAVAGTIRELGASPGGVQIALETPMGCGLGTCLGCALPRAGGGYLLACQDGPCVTADQLDWGRMTDAFHA